MTKRAELQKRNTFNKAANKSWIMRRTVKRQSARMTETRQRETAEGRGRVKIMNKSAREKCTNVTYSVLMEDMVWYHAAAFVHILYRPAVIIIMRRVNEPLWLRSRIPIHLNGTLCSL